MNSKYDRQTLFFGEKGQKDLAKTHVSIVGLGGIGSHVLQQLTFLGVGRITLIEDDTLDITNKNRLIGVNDSDVEGTHKLDIAIRLAKGINSKVKIRPIYDTVLSQSAFDELILSDYIIGCVDNDGARLFLNEIAVAYNIPYFDLATEIINENLYGGRVIFVGQNSPCLDCVEEIDRTEAYKFLSDEKTKLEIDTIYGIKKNEIGSGPSVITLNGVVASLACTEFMVHVTGIREAKFFLTYYANTGVTKERKGEKVSPTCFTCKQRGFKEKANILKRYRITK